MNRTELERAWPAAEPPPGFPERVLDRARPGPAPSRPSRRTGVLASLLARRLRWLLLPAVALALGGVLLVWATRPAMEGDVLAAEPRVISIGERAVAEMSSGAHVRWSGDDVQQDSGEVTYRVSRGARFRVQTPHGSITVLGTVFRVALASIQQTGGEPMNQRWAVAGGSAALGALLWVAVEQGSVRLSRGDDELVLRAGQSGSIGLDGVPRLEAAPGVAPADLERAPQSDDERTRTRRIADAVRRHAARRRAAMQAAKQASEKQEPRAPSASAPAPPPVQLALPDPPATPAPPGPAEEARRREYVQRTMREQYFPVARDCYEELLAREPTARGKVVLEFAIVGDADAGVVDRVALREEDTTIEDPEFRLCMRESMYTAVFEPPPPGSTETTVVYPVLLSPE